MKFVLEIKNSYVTIDIDTHRIRFQSNFTLSIEKCSPISVLAIFRKFLHNLC